MNKIKALIYYLSQGNPKVFGIMIISAFFVTLARLLAPLEMSWDPAVQLDAAHRLVQGLGLTTTVSPIPQYIDQIPANLNQAPTPHYLTSFPPGFSLLVASLLFVGISLASSLKILYSLATLLGWLAWAIIASHCLSKPLKLGSISFPAQFFLAALLPVFYTPVWIGTDIFLWSALPFMVLLLFNSAFKGSLNLPYLVTAGLIFGFQFSLRYAVLFVGIAAFFILLQINFPQGKAFLKSYFIFLISSLVLIIPVFIYIKLANSYNGISALPQVSFKSQYSGFFSTITEILQSSSAIANISGLPIQPKLAYHLDPNPSLYFIGIFFLIFTFLLPLLVFKRNKRASLDEVKRDFPLALSLLPASLVFFLLFCNFAGQYDFLGTPRYYLPVFLPTLFVCYESSVIKTRNIYKLIRNLFLIFIIMFFAYNLVARPLDWKPGSSISFRGIPARLTREVLTNSMMYRKDYRYPSNKVMIGYAETSAKVRELQKENPDALFFVQEYPFYVYDGHPGLRVIPVSEFWKKAYVDKAVKVFWVVKQKCPAVCTEHGKEVIDRLSSQPGLRTVFTSSQENREHTKILVSDLPSGYKF